MGRGIQHFSSQKTRGKIFGKIVCLIQPEAFSIKNVNKRILKLQLNWNENLIKCIITKHFLSKWKMLISWCVLDILANHFGGMMRDFWIIFLGACKKIRKCFPHFPGKIHFLLSREYKNYTHLQIRFFCRLQLSSHIDLEGNHSLITECYLLFLDLLEFPGKMTPKSHQLPKIFPMPISLFILKSHSKS